MSPSTHTTKSGYLLCQLGNKSPPRLKAIVIQAAARLVATTEPSIQGFGINLEASFLPQDCQKLPVATRLVSDPFVRYNGAERQESVGHDGHRCGMKDRWKRFERHSRLLLELRENSQGRTSLKRGG